MIRYMLIVITLQYHFVQETIDALCSKIVVFEKVFFHTSESSEFTGQVDGWFEEFN